MRHYLVKPHKPFENSVNEAKMRGFPEHLAYWYFRSIIRISDLLGPIKMKRLKNILNLAAVDELVERGYSKSEVAVRLGCSPPWVTSVIKSKSDKAVRPTDPHVARRILECLFDGGGCLEEWQLEDILASERGFTEANDFEKPDQYSRFYFRMDLALRQLSNWSLIRRRRKNGAGSTFCYELTDSGRNKLLKDLIQPMNVSVQLLEDVLSTVELLTASKPSTASELYSRLASPPFTLSVDRIDAVITWAQQNQDEATLCPIRIEKTAEGELFQLRHIGLISPSDPIDEQHIATIFLVKRVKEYIAWLYDEPSTREVAHKTIIFKAPPDRIHQFLKKHREWVFDSIDKLEASTKPDEFTKSYALTWIGQSLEENRR